MQTNPVPEIEKSELKTVREFLTSVREEERKERMPRLRVDSQGTVPIRNGIARARHRSAAKTAS